MRKREVKPFIDITIKDTIYKISFITEYSIKRICEDLFNHAIKSKLGSELAHYFKRELHIDGVLFQSNNETEKFEQSSEDTERISMTLNDKSYEYAYQIAYAMDCSVAKVVAYAIKRSMADFEFLNNYISNFLNKNVDKESKDLLMTIVKSVNKERSEELSVASLLLYIADEYRRFNEGVKGVLEDVMSR